MKRILIFSLTYHPYVGGAEVALKEITDRLEPDEYQFDMVTLRFDSRLPAFERVGNVDVYRIGETVEHPSVSDRDLPPRLRRAKLLFPFTALFKAITLHQRHPYDLVWTMSANQAGFAALFFKWLHPIPYVLELQDGNSFAQVKKRRAILHILWPLYRRIYLAADRIVVISSYIEGLARAIGYRKEISVIPNAVDVARFSAPVSGERLWELKNRFGKEHGDVYLVTVSRLVEKNAVDDIVRALPHLKPTVKLLIIGDGEDRRKIESLAHTLKVTDRVVFVGTVDNDDVPEYLKMCDIFVRPSLVEGFGVSFVEAFAAGIPVVATPVGGIVDFLFDPWKDPEIPSTGIFCKVRDPQSIADAVMKYLADPALTATIVKNAKKLAVEKYDWDGIAERMQSEVFDTVFS